MIHIDNRVGSRHLSPLLKTRGLPCALERLDYADIAFSGSGPSGDTSVGIELKRVDDLVGSLSTRRFQSHQLPGLVRNYEWPILIVEGEYRESSDGLIEKGVGFGPRVTWFRLRSPMTFDRLEGTLFSLTFKTNFRVFQTRDAHHTARTVARLYQWWTAKKWDEHMSLKVGGKLNPMEGRIPVDPWFSRARHFVESVALDAPGLGPNKGLAAARHFRSVRKMSWAGVEAWRQVRYKNKSGKLVRMGPRLARKLYEIFKKEM